MTTDLRPPIDPAASPPWPLAVGVLLLPADLADPVRAEQRLALALGAYRLGYFLLDLVEVDAYLAAGSSSQERATAWRAVETLATRAGADALVIRSQPPTAVPGGLPDALAALPVRLLVG